MGKNIDAVIAYGVELKNDTNYPWNDYDDFQDWWLAAIGFKPTKPVWNEGGDYLPGVTDTDVEDYFDERDFALKNEPMPVSLDFMGYSHDDSPVIVIEESIICASGEIEMFDPSSLAVGSDWDNRLRNFQENQLGTTEPARWLLYGKYW